MIDTIQSFVKWVAVPCVVIMFFVTLNNIATSLSRIRFALEERVNQENRRPAPIFNRRG